MKKLTCFMFIAVLLAAGCAEIDDGMQTAGLTPRSGDIMIGEDTGPDLQDVVAVYDTAVPVELDVAVVDNGNATVDATEMPRYSYVVVIADPHIKNPDSEYVDHVRQIGEDISRMPWPIEAVFALGDICYLLPYTTMEEFENDPADRFDLAQELFEDFPVPVYPLLGNHDMDNGPVPWVDLAEQLFKKHFDVDPYYAIDIGNWRLLALDNFKGPTHDIDAPTLDRDSGSLGAEQLAWMEEQAADGKPMILMTHFPLYAIQDLAPFIREHRDVVRLELAGHSHAWMNLSDALSVPSMVVGACHSDADSLLIIELDNQLGTWRIVNWDKIHWGSAYALPWDGSETVE